MLVVNNYYDIRAIVINQVHTVPCGFALFCFLTELTC